MPRREYVLSGYRGMWLFALFDLPVNTKKARRRYAQFRRLLLEEGFSQLQYSVYARYCASQEHSNTQSKRIREAIPPKGNVRLLSITDRQFGKMEVFYGKTPLSPEEAPQQLLLF